MPLEALKERNAAKGLVTGNEGHPKWATLPWTCRTRWIRCGTARGCDEKSTALENFAKPGGNGRRMEEPHFGLV